jgi:hypothetical protein
MNYWKRFIVNLLPYIALSLIVIIPNVFVLVDADFNVVGFDTLYHIKYASAIIAAQKVITYNPYFPHFPLAYPLGSHIIVADLSLLSGGGVIPIVSLTPILFGIPILFAFYAFSRRFLNSLYSILAALLFYGASIIPASETAVNGAPVANSIVYPYVAVLAGIFLLYVFLLSLSFNRGVMQSVITGSILGVLVLTFHLLALGALLVLVGFTIIANFRKQIWHTILILFVAIAVGYPYLIHIVHSGLPSETTAFSTYVQLGIQDYINIFGLPITIMLVIGAFLLVFRKASLDRSLTSSTSVLVLVAFIVTFLIATQAWQFGFILVNDLFAFHVIGGVAIVAAAVVAKISGWLLRHDGRIIATVIVAALILIGPISAINNAGILSGGERGYGPVVGWMNANKVNSLVASDTFGEILIPSETSALPVAIPPTIADYYISGLDSRASDLSAVFGYCLACSLGVINGLNIPYIVTTGPHSIGTIFGTDYIYPVFPQQSCFQGSGPSYDFIGDGIPQTFDQYPPLTTMSYILTNPKLSPGITIDYLFNQNDSGPVQVYVNDTLVKILAHAEPKIWINDEINLPSNVVSSVEDVRIVNLNATNYFYLQYIGVGSIQGCSDTSGGIFSVFEINRNSSSIGTFQSQIISGRSIYSVVNATKGPLYAYVWCPSTICSSNSNKNVTLEVSDYYQLGNASGPISVSVYSHPVGLLKFSPSNTTNWENQTISIPISDLSPNVWDEIILTNLSLNGTVAISNLSFSPSG